jgi:hypothetical protein
VSERTHSAERIYAGAVAATHNAAIRKVILLERFQFGLPVNRNAIMLRATGAYPVGDQPPNPCELPS